MAVVGMMSAMRDAPSVVRDHDGGVDNVTHKVVQSLVVAERLVTAVMANHEKGPEHGSLSKPVEGPHKGVVQGGGSEGEGTHDGHILDEVGERANSVFLQALLGDRVAEILKGEWRGVGQLATTLQ